MTDEQLIEKIAEILFNEEEIDAWRIFDNLEALFINEHPEVRKKYLEWQKNEELRAKEQEVMELGIRLAKAQQELKELLTPEFLSTLHTAVECCNWDVDMVESMEFCKWCYSMVEKQCPNFNVNIGDESDD